MSCKRQTFDLASIATTGDILKCPAQRAPGKTALITNGEAMTFGQLDALSNRFAHALIALELARGEKIAIICRNGFEYVAAHFGAARTHLVLVHLSTRFTPDELAHALNLTQTGVLIVDNKTHETYSKAASKLALKPIVIGIDDGLPADVTKFENFIAGFSDADPGLDIDPGDPFAILFTGGTTGRPRGAITTHISRITSGTAAIEDHPVSNIDVAAVTTPLCHAAGLFTWFQPVIQAGATAVLMPHWDAGAFMDAVEAHAITCAFVVPVQVAFLLDHPDFSPDRLKTLRAIMCGGATAAPKLIERFEHLLPNADFVVAYGSTETGHVISQQPEERRAKPGSLGRVGARIELKIFKQPGIEARLGEIGEIATKGPHLFKGYFDAPDETKAYFRSGDGWGWTGDLGVMDKDGVITLIGRSNDMILSGGMNVYPAEIEDAVLAHEDVAECAAFGVPDDEWGELPAIAVVPVAGRTIEPGKIIEFAAGRIARYKRPRVAKILDRLPRTDAGKLQRHVLKERFGNET